MQADHYHFALSTLLRPAESESCYFPSAAKSWWWQLCHNGIPSSNDGKHECEVSSRGEFGCGYQGHYCGFDWCELVLVWKFFG